MNDQDVGKASHAPERLSLFPQKRSAAKSEPTIQGVWTHKEVESIGGPGEGTDSNPQPGLVFITKNYYCSNFVSSADPRPVFKTQTPSDKQIEEAYNNFIAVAGPYELKGPALILHPAVSPEPDLMEGGSLEFEYQLDGDTLTLTLDPAKIAYTTREYKPDFTKAVYVLKRLE
jgi:hypothetical protein